MLQKCYIECWNLGEAAVLVFQWIWPQSLNCRCVRSGWFTRPRLAEKGLELTVSIGSGLLSVSPLERSPLQLYQNGEIIEFANWVQIRRLCELLLERRLSLLFFSPSSSIINLNFSALGCRVLVVETNNMAQLDSGRKPPAGFCDILIGRKGVTVVFPYHGTSLPKP